MTTSQNLVLVEDNADDVELMMRAFRAADIRCDVRVARDGAAAIELLLDRATRRRRPSSCSTSNCRASMASTCAADSRRSPHVEPACGHPDVFDRARRFAEGIPARR
jgi:hypothetical protein